MQHRTEVAEHVGNVAVCVVVGTNVVARARVEFLFIEAYLARKVSCSAEINEYLA